MTSNDEQITLVGDYRQYVDVIADRLATVGYVVIEQAFAACVITDLAAVLMSRRDAMAIAAVGRQGDRHVDTSVRGDRIDWLDASHGDVVANFLASMDEIRVSMNARLFLGLQEYEAHFASYSPGAFYQKHRDAFRGAPSRKLSSVLYLNQDWDSSAGGELVLYDESGEIALHRVTPNAGTLVLFLSEDFPHEVLPATCERMSIAGWFRVAS